MKEIGSIVKLKSGGPPMTVDSVKEGRAKVVWFDGTKKKTAELPIECLQGVIIGPDVLKKGLKPTSLPNCP